MIHFWHYTLNEIGVKDHQNWWFTVSTNSIFATLYWWFYPPLVLHQKLVFFIPPLLGVCFYQILVVISKSIDNLAPYIDGYFQLY